MTRRVALAAVLLALVACGAPRADQAPASDSAAGAAAAPAAADSVMASDTAQNR